MGAREKQQSDNDVTPSNFEGGSETVTSLSEPEVPTDDLPPPTKRHNPNDVANYVARRSSLSTSEKYELLHSESVSPHL